MNLRIYQLQVLAGFLLCALREGLFFVGGPSLPRGIPGFLEAGVVLFCGVGIWGAGRDLRTAFEAFGHDKNLARCNPDYMRARSEIQIMSVGAVAALGVVIARRYGVSDAIPLAVAAAMGVSLPFVNRLSGWVRSDQV